MFEIFGFINIENKFQSKEIINIQNLSNLKAVNKKYCEIVKIAFDKLLKIKL